MERVRVAWYAAMKKAREQGFSVVFLGLIIDPKGQSGELLPQLQPAIYLPPHPCLLTARQRWTMSPPRLACLRGSLTSRPRTRVNRYSTRKAFMVVPTTVYDRSLMHFSTVGSSFIQLYDMTSGCYLCSDCNTVFSTFDELQTHIDHVHLQTNAEDEEQISPPNAEMMIDVELPSSSDDPMMGDDDVNKESDDDSSSLTSSDVIGFQCRFCPVKCEDQNQLNIHYLHLHQDRPRYECEECHAIFAVKRELATHMRIHSGEQPHKCTQCGKEFGTRQLLKKHWMWHTGERSHVCPHCGKAFFQKGHLTQHLMIHSGGRPHRCQQCQKTFIFKFDLNRHMKIHQERGFSCQRCGRSFLRQLLLDEHSTRCKGKSSPAASRQSSSPVKPEPIFQNLGSQLILNDQMTKMAQNLVAQQQQRALAAILAQQQQPTPPAVAPAAFFCVLCNKGFPNQPAFTVHMYLTHIAASSAVPACLPPPAIENIQTTQLTGLTMPVDQVQVNVNEQHETATNTSCASSPQKSPPFAESSSSSQHSEESVSPASQSPCPSDSKCRDCFSHGLRLQQLENQLVSKGEELDNYKKIMKTVRSIDLTSLGRQAKPHLVVLTSGQLLSQCPPDNMFILHVRNIFDQLRSAL
ncbi:unnamed protein product [Caenorhabditis auriculariae]|uniref:C2H2-type domain-containing protein n=1 Tax=Caenorhabditis auriculariae TaxID=2777116 RepID=A0A8S1HPF1_9PELO|nr:unnamed protein product [Caenorhabditis auriculariae]